METVELVHFRKKHPKDSQATQKLKGSRGRRAHEYAVETSHQSLGSTRRHTNHFDAQPIETFTVAFLMEVRHLAFRSRNSKPKAFGVLR